MSVNPETSSVSRGDRVGRFRWWSYLAFGLLFAALYWFRPIATEAITVWPSWLWAIGFTAVLAPWRKKGQYRRFLLPATVWFVSALGFSEAWRLILPLSSTDAKDVRVVSFNTGGFMEEAVMEAVRYQPDVILVQESAVIANPEGVYTKLLGNDYTYVMGVDASVFVRGRIEATDTDRQNRTFVHAVLKSGARVDIVSLRMQPPWPRLDYWNLGCWKSYSEHRKQHHAELSAIMAETTTFAKDGALLIGGDFNLVPDREQQVVLGSDMADAFAIAGRGWYGTALNSLPLFRIDKIWSNEFLKPISCWSVKSEYSDHRMVVADFELVHK